MGLLKKMVVWLRRLLLLAWCLLLAIAVSKFYMDNTAITEVVLFGHTLADVAVSRVIFITFGLGLALAFIILLPWVLWLRGSLIKARYRLAKAQVSLQSLDLKPVK